jgi:hypothetical protein
MIKYFTEHPQSVNETYVQHLFQTIKFAGIFFLSGVVVIIHGVFPFAFSTTATELLLGSLRKSRPDLFEKDKD